MSVTAILFKTKYGLISRKKGRRSWEGNFISVIYKSRTILGKIGQQPEKGGKSSGGKVFFGNTSE